ncbi:MAG: diguanylate cyclase, partial [Alphaproteobacteria bacterium]|nr:diguanylate cyclase [Alphaproteobacteria bacterium]
DLSDYDFIQRQKRLKEGYLEYDWKNPGEQTTRPKALYMTYFGPWDWIISASSYREEFKNLFSVDDFRDSVLSVSFGRTGYSFVMDSKGSLIIHPKIAGHNIFDSVDSDGRYFIREICEKKNGKIVYPWMNPGDNIARNKLVIFNYIPELDWIVASSSYLQEFYEPLRTITYTIFGSVGIMLALVIPMMWWISSAITRPLSDLMGRFSAAAGGDFTARMEVTSGDEIGMLSRYYNTFMEWLTESSRRLTQSEERFRGIFEGALEGIFQALPSGRILAANPSLAAMLGYDSPQRLMDEVTDFGSQLFADGNRIDEIMGLLDSQPIVTGYETQWLRRDRSATWVSLNLRAVRDAAGALEYIEGFVTDIAARKEAEEVQRLAHEKLEQRVAERTAELSNWIKALESRDRQNALLREMSEMLQVCRTSQETYPVISNRLSAFFPDMSGRLYVFGGDGGGQFVYLVASWGPDFGRGRRDIAADDCWGLRQGKPYLNGGSDGRIPCPHLGGGIHGTSLCVPLVAQGETVGLLTIEPPRHAEAALERDQGLAAMLAEHLALALTNLNLRETLSRRSLQDVLTGLANRRFLEEVAERECHRALRRGTILGLIMVDVDHFKRFNDTYGHDVGDMVLKELGAVLIRHSRSEDIVCRLGGEEFVVVIEAASVDEVARKAEELCRNIRDEVGIRHGAEPLRVTASLGVAVYPGNGTTFWDVLKTADKALYHAKSGGRDRVVFAPTTAAALDLL